MLYDITLSVQYSYTVPAGAGHHALRLTPINVPDVQRVITSNLELSPEPSSGRDRTDFFGNPVRLVSYRGPTAATRFDMRARVERFEQPATVDVSPPLARLPHEISSVRSLASASPHHFTGRSPRVAPDAAVSAWARQTVRGEETCLAAVRRIGSALHALMDFDADATAVDTDHGAAFAARRGVCQDYSHIMIAGLRAIGIPAGYVSGFLRTIPPEGKARLEGADAMHAWVRAWCGLATGWVEFDPTNDMTVGQDHVVVAYGRDYFDVAPVKGQLRLSGRQTTRHTVDMIAV